jgi:hypothetical protein
MRTIETEVYEFHELSEQAKKNAIKYFREHREIMLDFFNDDCVNYANERSFEDIELQLDIAMHLLLILTYILKITLLL